MAFERFTQPEEDTAAARTARAVAKEKDRLVRVHFASGGLKEETLTPSELKCVELGVAGKKYKLGDKDSPEAVETCIEYMTAG